MRTIAVHALTTFLLLSGCATGVDGDIAALEEVAALAPDDLDLIDRSGEVQVVRAVSSLPQCPGITLDGIESYDGFRGYYLRSAPYVDDELVTLHVLTLEENPESISTTGNYQALVRRGSLFAFETGRYLAAPNNPAIGPALGLDLDRDGFIDELYWVLGATRNAYGRIDTLCLGKSRDDGSGSPFLMTRVGW
jgi:hypothetical protein